MDAHAVLHPVGPHEPRVYWTRRAILLLAVLLVLILVVAYGCSGGSGHPAATPRTTPSPTPTPTPTANPSTGSAACTKSELSVVASTDATTYPAGVLPHLTATIRTGGPAPCQLPVSALRWQIVSGTDTVYSTEGCAAGSRATVTLRPGHPVRTGRIWDRHRSLPGCTTPGSVSGAGTYQLTVSVDGVQSAVAVFHLAG